MKIRLKFTKTGPVKFVGHLDLMRTFQKVFRRSHIPIAYSEGYSPHQIFSIAAPLAVGLTSDGEYLDMTLTEDITDFEAFVEQINQVSPNGIHFEQAVEVSGKEMALMALVAGAKYKVFIHNPIVNQEQLDTFFAQENIFVTKQNKKGVWKETDVKPGILCCTLFEEGLLMTLATGSTFNIKPEAILKALYTFLDLELNSQDYAIHRLDVYQEVDGQLVGLI